MEFLLFAICLVSFSYSATIKTTLRVSYNCHSLQKARLDTHPTLSLQSKQIIASEICKLVNDPFCQPYLMVYDSEEVEVRRLLADYETMFLFLSVRISAPFQTDDWLQFQNQLTSYEFLAGLSEKVRLANDGKCFSFVQAAFPQQSDSCWDFDIALENNIRVQNPSQPGGIRLFENEFCSFRVLHQKARCDHLQEENGIPVAKLVSMATYNIHSCANKASADPECGWSFSWDKMEGVCTCSRPGFICSERHSSLYADVYGFRSGNFGEFMTFGAEEEPETTEQAQLQGSQGEEEEGKGAEAEGNKGEEEEENKEAGAETEEEEVDDDAPRWHQPNYGPNQPNYGPGQPNYGSSQPNYGAPAQSGYGAPGQSGYGAPPGRQPNYVVPGHQPSYKGPKRRLRKTASKTLGFWTLALIALFAIIFGFLIGVAINKSLQKRTVEF